MVNWRWPAGAAPEDLGAIAHGPVLLGRGTGIGAGLRCVVAHPEGLRFVLVVRARDVWAEAAGRQSFGSPAGLGPFWDDAVPVVGSEPRLVVGVDEHVGPADPCSTTSSGGVDEFTLEATYWIAALPRDGLLQLTLSWPQAGLEETTTGVALAGLDDVPARVVHLLT